MTHTCSWRGNVVGYSIETEERSYQDVCKYRSGAGSSSTPFSRNLDKTPDYRAYDPRLPGYCMDSSVCILLILERAHCVTHLRTARLHHLSVYIDTPTSPPSSSSDYHCLCRHCGGPGWAFLLRWAFRCTSVGLFHSGNTIFIYAGRTTPSPTVHRLPTPAWHFTATDRSLQESIALVRTGLYYGHDSFPDTIFQQLHYTDHHHHTERLLYR